MITNTTTTTEATTEAIVGYEKLLAGGAPTNTDAETLETLRNSDRYRGANWHRVATDEGTVSVAIIGGRLWIDGLQATILLTERVENHEDYDQDLITPIDHDHYVLARTWEVAVTASVKTSERTNDDGVDARGCELQDIWDADVYCGDMPADAVALSDIPDGGVVLTEASIGYNNHHDIIYQIRNVASELDLTALAGDR